MLTEVVSFLCRLSFYSVSSLNLKTLPPRQWGTFIYQNIYIVFFSYNFSTKIIKFMSHFIVFFLITFSSSLVEVWVTLLVEWVVIFSGFGSTTHILKICFSLSVNFLQAQGLLWWETNSIVTQMLCHNFLYEWMKVKVKHEHLFWELAGSICVTRENASWRSWGIDLNSTSVF